MPVTIKDIAEAANVSHTTVSRALKGQGRISPATVARIQELATEMGYSPSAVAQSLVTQRTFTIGVVVTTIADPFVSNVVNGIEDAAQAAGYSVFLSSSHRDSEREVAVVEKFYQRRVDAVIVTASRVGSLYGMQAQPAQVPIVLINNQGAGDYVYSVASDEIQGMRLAVDHLGALGHHRIGFIGSADRPFSSQRRQLGYQAAMTNHDLPVDPALVTTPDVREDLEAGHQGLLALLPAGPTAIITYNDMTAVGVMMAAKEQGFALPEQLSLVGFDDIELTRFLKPALTTVNQPKSAMGRAAVEMVLALLAGEVAHDRVLPCRLEVRQSTAAV